MSAADGRSGEVDRPRPASGAHLQETVLNVHHWTDSLFSFSTTRDPAFRFRAGQFTMIGLQVDGRPLLRAYSVVSAPYEERLEFLSIKVPDGPLTSRLQHIRQGDTVLVGRKPVGTLLPDNLLSGRVLWLLGTGTGLAPFLSLVRDPETYDRFDQVVLVHGCRTVAELAYGDLLTEQLPRHELLGELIAEKFRYHPTVTREPFRNQGRITDLIADGTLAARLGLPPIDVAHDRMMLCGSPALLADMRAWLEARDFVEGSQAQAGQFVIEKAFVEK